MEIALPDSREMHSIRERTLLTGLVRKAHKVHEPGQRCEARFNGKSKYYSGTIVRYNCDSTYEIEYDDGNSEKRVATSLIRAIENLRPVRTEKDFAKEMLRLQRLRLKVKGEEVCGANYLKDPNYWARKNRPGPPMPSWIEVEVRLPSCQDMKESWEDSVAQYMEKKYGKYLPENPVGLRRPLSPKPLTETLQRAIASSGLHTGVAQHQDVEALQSAIDESDLRTGVRQNHAAAVDLLRKAADDKDATVEDRAKAQSNLALMYKYGWGVSQNDTTAAAWMHRAADQGDTKAQSNLSVMYRTGRGVRQSDTLADEWLQKVAGQDQSKDGAQ